MVILNAASMIALVIFNTFVTVEAIHKELYTTNAICRRQYCVNPIFPGLEDLHRLDKAKWTCATLQKTAPSMDFCRGAINYNPALPTPASASTTLATLVKQQEQAAITMYAYHLSGMGIEYWDHTKPDHGDDDCIKSVWRMVCYTYFPKAGVMCKEGEESAYLRPCSSSCYNYIRSCQVECCDESVQCVFNHEKQLSSKASLQTFGYTARDGPSSLCTGGARRGQGMSFWILVACLFFSMCNMGDAASFDASSFSVAGTRCWAMLKVLSMGLIVALAFVLQGCDADVPTHVVGNWRGEDDYLITFEFIPPEGNAKDAKLNSCSFPHLAQTLQCSGRGICKAWDPDNLANPISFCFTGADLFYLGFPIAGAAKLATGGGLGLWWVIDIVRLGSAPVYARDFRVAADLPHWAYVLATLSFFCLLGFMVVAFNVLKYRRRKRKDALLMQAEEEAREPGMMQPHHMHDHRHHHHKVPNSAPQMGPSGPYMHRM